ncbi:MULTISPECIES: VOC family protein [Motilimonas]|uniref:VOC family protein n=1 Tax=Motilimonas cestriensis TaxID=2742685 RepID=A0ABS8WGK0_9GAMM|nr:MULTISPECIES: VOC family protein [Motilimonas]MCE0555583.1 VOC family protein [Motilimonas sp. E26]MCE2597418.1 VOC family protein [Motilimonas cestriensis]
MIDHFEIRTINFHDCKRFYEKVLLPLKIEIKWSDKSAAGFGIIGEDKVRFLIEKSDNCTNSHIAFSASSKKSVEKFYQVALSEGYQCNGKPGLRENYAPNYYAAFVLDPDGNNVEAVVYL